MHLNEKMAGLNKIYSLKPPLLLKWNDHASAFRVSKMLTLTYNIEFNEI